MELDLMLDGGEIAWQGRGLWLRLAALAQRRLDAGDLADRPRAHP